MSSAFITTKPGASLRLECAETVEATGAVVPTTDWTISSHMTNAAGARVVFDVERVDDAIGRYDLVLEPAASLALVAGNWKCDIRRQFGTDVDLSDTFTIVVEPGVTNA